MEITPPGENWLLDMKLEVGRWLHLLDQYFSLHLGVYAAVIITVAALTCAAIVYFMLQRPNMRRSTKIIFAVAVGLATIIQLSLAVSVPRMAEEFGFGHSASCQVFERDDEGKLVFDAFPTIIDGEKKAIMVARKILYRVDSSPVSGAEKDLMKLGFLLVPNEKIGDFPTFCAIPLDEEANKLLDDIQIQKTPVDTEAIFQALLMEQNGFIAHYQTTLIANDEEGEINAGVRLFLLNLLSKMPVENLRPLNLEVLVEIMSQAAEASNNNATFRLVTWMQTLLKKQLISVGLSEEDAELVTDDWIAGMGNYHYWVVDYVKGEKDPSDALAADAVTYLLAKYGLNRDALLEVMDSVLRQLSVRYSGVYAAEVVRIIEELKLHERRPLIFLPGDPLWYITDLPEGGEGEGESEGESQSESEALNEALSEATDGRIMGEKFGEKAAPPTDGGNKDDKDRG